MRPYFAAIVPGSDLPVFLKAARLIGVSPGCCVVVEDAIAGVQTSRRAGMRCIAVTTTNPAGASQDADLVVERLDALTTRAAHRPEPGPLARNRAV